MTFFTTQDEDLHLPGETTTLRGEFAQLSDGRTHYELRGPGRGPLAVLVPGLTVPLFYWDDVAEHLHAAGIDTLGFSAYGRGYSERVIGPYDQEMFVRQLRELLVHLGRDQSVNLVGTSLGALIGMAFTLDLPANVRSLVFVGPAGLSGNKLSKRLLQPDRVATVLAQRFGRRLLLGHLERNVSDPLLVDPLTTMVSECYRYEGSMYSFFSTLQHFSLSTRHELFRETGDLGIPTMLAWGSDDQVTPISALDDARRLLRPVAVEVLQGCGHMAPYERPAAVAHLVSTFIRTPHRTESES